MRAALTIAFLALTTAYPARSQDQYQDWIHKNVPRCCDHRDCQPATVKLTTTGWQVEGADNVVPFTEVIAWPFGVPYACIIARRARCLFLAGGG